MFENKVIDEIPKGTMGVSSLHLSYAVNYLPNRLCQSEFNRKIQVKRLPVGLFEDTTTIIGHKHEFMGL